MAKEAVFISMPRKSITHWSEALLPLPVGFMEEEEHGVVWSLSRTPFSRASCSRVIGMNEPGYCKLLLMIHVQYVQGISVLCGG